MGSEDVNWVNVAEDSFCSNWLKEHKYFSNNNRNGYTCTA